MTCGPRPHRALMRPIPIAKTRGIIPLTLYHQFCIQLMRWE
jgi:hypothetical protein